MDMPRTSKITDKSRRRVVSALSLGTAFTITHYVPSTWRKPVVDTLLLPAHAQTSPALPASATPEDPTDTPTVDPAETPTTDPATSPATDPAPSPTTDPATSPVKIPKVSAEE